ncbi:class I SAM-dependent DNA methyltransferase [Sphingomonas sp. SRS2]|uniref:class I SAM-dependent DNA methyltransferase n=1 Tax=Sphingomonas sp. SRS2 TaxID=133190 RepID=UPI00061842AB|nr:DNA methyltransferase [Sphingomonas sp. SRS2]KKC24346.1 lactate dehydrogenase [Sphingomonas sp. SRS2]
MNAVEIEEAVSDLVLQPFDADEFPFQFLAAFGAKDTTLKRLRKGESNQSDVGGVLWRNNIHVATAAPGAVGPAFAALRDSPKTLSQKAKFILATDGETFEAEDLVSGDVPAGPYVDLPRHFATFLPLAGISPVKEIKNTPIDVKATGRLNRLYVELLKDNPDWATEAKRSQLNQFMAQLIFCFFAEDTDIFHGSYKFTPTVERMTSGQADDTQAVIAELFRAMGTRPEHRAVGKFPTWADGFPYVNGGYLFSGAAEAPYFGRTARAYLLRAGELDWKEINPDIFGSMIQAVADDDERGELGMHYTSVPNILKVLNPLFLDSLREQLKAAGDSKQRLRNLRKRLAGIRVFDPACGSGNFLVIAYKEMRAIEATIVVRLGGEANLKLEERRSVIPLSNFYGIEIKGFAAEIARLALLIAEFQADCLYLSQQEARAMVLPLHKTGQITVGNALRIDWLEICPPITSRAVAEEDLAGPTGRLVLEENGLGVQIETFICGNPPYKGSQQQTSEQKRDLESAFGSAAAGAASADYVAGWPITAAKYSRHTRCEAAFVMTNSICQGRQVPTVWATIFEEGLEIKFAYTSFTWANLASHNAGVTVVVVGISRDAGQPRRLIASSGSELNVRDVANINAYLVAGPDIRVLPERRPLSMLPELQFGNMPNDGGNLLLTAEEAREAIDRHGVDPIFVKDFIGSQEFIHGLEKRCIWVDDDSYRAAQANQWLATRFENVRKLRTDSSRPTTQELASVPYRFGEVRQRGGEIAVVLPRITSENREYLPVGLVKAGAIISSQNFAIYNAPLWCLSMLASQLHRAWIAVVCGRTRTDFAYSNTLGWNTFPVPKLTEHNKADLTRTAENILLAREAHFPATIANLYDPETMPDDLRRAHDDNDEVLERIYIGRHFRNDTERLERLFDLYTKMTADTPKTKKGKKAA